MINDLVFMSLAFDQAKKAYSIGEVPIGAVLINDQGIIVARAYNQVETKKTQLAHAEMQVIAKASKKIRAWRLGAMTMYVTVQPCMMCMGALYLSRIARVVYGVSSPKFGMQIGEINIGGIYQNLHTSVQCIDYEPAKALLQLFFQKKRSEQYGKQGRFSKN